jgi:predicted GNAT family acetyltransferase
MAEGGLDAGAMSVSADRVQDNAAASRFELHVATKEHGEKIAFSEYKIVGDTIHMLHTESPPELQGMGVGGKLVRGALTLIRARGLKVVARCPFVRAFLQKHDTEFGDLVVK